MTGNPGLLELPESGGYIPAHNPPCGTCSEPAKVVLRVARRRNGADGRPVLRTTIEAVCPKCFEAGRMLNFKKDDEWTPIGRLDGRGLTLDPDDGGR